MPPVITTTYSTGIIFCWNCEVLEDSQVFSSLFPFMVLKLYLTFLSLSLLTYKMGMVAELTQG